MGDTLDYRNNLTTEKKNVHTALQNNQISRYLHTPNLFKMAAYKTFQQDAIVVNFTISYLSRRGKRGCMT